ncbi:MAG TPA: hypothetical protein VLT89_00895 [Usitatibacter sp.]|nr:hypothetical protein [Usitatibacter sp.]
MSASIPITRESDTARTIEHVVHAIESAPEGREPFFHLRLAAVLPDDIYAAMLEAMPVPADYRPMSGRAKSSRNGAETDVRTKIDLLPEQIRLLPRAKRPVWQVVGDALTSAPVREAFRKRLSPGLAERFGDEYTGVDMYPIPILTRDVAGYQIGVHPDTKWKGMTIQIYLPRDRSIEHVGTLFHRKSATPGQKYDRVSQVPFAPNSGYAFAVGKETYHSVDTVGPEVTTRDSILLTYFLDKTFVQVVQNRAKRLGNFLRAEIRSVGRSR